jgi:hypothetical protein
VLRTGCAIFARARSAAAAERRGGGAALVMATPMGSSAPGAGQAYPIVRGSVSFSKKQEVEAVPSVGGALVYYLASARCRRVPPRWRCHLHLRPRAALDRRRPATGAESNPS